MSRHDQGWAQNSPIAEADRRADLRWARFVFFSQAAVGLLLLWGIILAVGALVATFTPGGGHGF